MGGGYPIGTLKSRYGVVDLQHIPQELQDYEGSIQQVYNKVGGADGAPASGESAEDFAERMLMNIGQLSPDQREKYFNQLQKQLSKNGMSKDQAGDLCAWLRTNSDGAEVAPKTPGPKIPTTKQEDIKPPDIKLDTTASDAQLKSVLDTPAQKVYLQKGAQFTGPNAAQEAQDAKDRNAKGADIYATGDTAHDRKFYSPADNAAQGVENVAANKEIFRQGQGQAATPQGDPALAKTEENFNKAADYYNGLNKGYNIPHITADGKWAKDKAGDEKTAAWKSLQTAAKTEDHVNIGDPKTGEADGVAGTKSVALVNDRAQGRSSKQVTDDVAQHRWRNQSGDSVSVSSRGGTGGKPSSTMTEEQLHADEQKKIGDDVSKVKDAAKPELDRQWKPATTKQQETLTNLVKDAGFQGSTADEQSKMLRTANSPDKAAAMKAINAKGDGWSKTTWKTQSDVVDKWSASDPAQRSALTDLVNKDSFKNAGEDEQRRQIAALKSSSGASTPAAASSKTGSSGNAFDTPVGELKGDTKGTPAFDAAYAHITTRPDGTRDETQWNRLTPDNQNQVANAYGHATAEERNRLVQLVQGDGFQVSSPELRKDVIDAWKKNKDDDEFPQAIDGLLKNRNFVEQKWGAGDDNITRSAVIRRLGDEWERDPSTARELIADGKSKSGMALRSDAGGTWYNWGKNPGSWARWMQPLVEDADSTVKPK
jgi:hypothetical protein